MGAGDKQGTVVTVSVDGSPRINRALAKQAAAKGRLDEASRLLTAAAEAVAADDPLAPALAKDLNNLGNAHGNAGMNEVAATLLQKALVMLPDYALAHANLAAILIRLMRYEEALGHLDRANELAAPTADRLCLQGSVYQNLKRVDESRRCFRAALALDPDHAASLDGDLHARLLSADWDGLAEDAARLVALADHGDGQGSSHRMRPFLSLLLAFDDDTRHRIAVDWAAKYVPDPPAQPLSRPGLHRRRDGPLRVGYLSADFRRHPTAHLMLSLFAAHDRRRVVVHAYSIGPDDGSPQRRRIENDSNRFVDLRGHDDAAAAAAIAADDIDILVDLMVFTRLSRPGILARRPAPVQVAYLGFPGTSGAPWLDYILADAVVLPPENRSFFSEKALILPRCYQVNDPGQEMDDGAARRADWSLPEDAVVFACFNLINKIEPTVFGLWMDILKAAPSSVLWLLADRETARLNLRGSAAGLGVDPERLVFGPRVARPLHLRRQQCADLFLDTLIYNAHTTASDALFAGLPLLTCPSQSFAGRVAASLLTALGVEEMIVPDVDTYRATAIALANDPGRLAGLRARITAAVRDGPLYDIDGFARDLERGFELIHANRLAGHPPRHIEVPAAA